MVRYNQEILATMNQAAQEIINSNPDLNISLREVLDLFYILMRKFEVKEHIPAAAKEGEELRFTVNFDWVSLKSTFFQMVMDEVVHGYQFQDTPEDLRQ